MSVQDAPTEVPAVHMGGGGSPPGTPKIHIKDYGNIALCGARIKGSQVGAAAGERCGECIHVKQRSMLGRFSTR